MVFWHPSLANVRIVFYETLSNKSQQKIIKSSNKQNKPSFTGLLCGTCRKAPMKTGCSCGFTTIHPSANHHDVSSLTGWIHNHNQKFVDKNHPPRVLQPIKKSSKKKNPSSPTTSSERSVFRPLIFFMAACRTFRTATFQARWRIDQLTGAFL